MLQLTIKMINELNNNFMFFQFGIIAVHITKVLRRKKNPLRRGIEPRSPA